MAEEVRISKEKEGQCVEAYMGGRPFSDIVLEEGCGEALPTCGKSKHLFLQGGSHGHVCN